MNIFIKKYKFLLIAIFLISSTLHAADKETLLEGILPLSTGEKIAFTYPKKWKMLLNPYEQTIKLYSANEKDPVYFLMTFVDNDIHKTFPLKEKVAIITKLSEKYVSASAEGKVLLYSLETALGHTIYTGLTEKNHQAIKVLPEGEFSSIKIGMASNEALIMSFTILSNGTNTQELIAAQKILSGFSIIKAEKPKK